MSLSGIISVRGKSCFMAGFLFTDMCMWWVALLRLLHLCGKDSPDDFSFE